MKHHCTPEGKTNDWITPTYIMKQLGKFDFDPCPYPKPEWDGLSLEWSGRIWCNPPFSRSQRELWMQKMAEHGNGIMLIPAATETNAFYRWVWLKATAICFLRGRPHFYYPSGIRAPFNSGTAIVLIAYGDYNARILSASTLGVTIQVPLDITTDLILNAAC